MRGLQLVLGSAALLLVSAATAHAQDAYPNKPVHLVVGFTPGSVADITARVVGNKMGQILGQQFVIENKVGAGSSIAAEYVARSPKDGYTLYLPGSANIANAAINPKLSFDIIKDFAPIGLVSAAAVILVVHPSLAVNNVQELIALLKSKPGELSYASTGIGSAPHFSAELFMQRTGTKMVHVPYPGSPQAATAVIALVKAGKLKLLASTGAKRPAIVPDVPTMIESGMPDFDTAIWFGLTAPAGTPKPVIDKLAAALHETVQAPDVIAAWRPQGVDPLDGGPDTLAKLNVAELKRWTDVATAAGLKK